MSLGIRERNPAFRQQIFDVAEAQGESEIEPNRLLNDLRREPVPFVADFLHPLGYWTARGTASPKRRDNASGGDGRSRRFKAIKSSRGKSWARFHIVDPKLLAGNAVSSDVRWSLLADGCVDVSAFVGPEQNFERRQIRHELCRHSMTLRITCEKRVISEGFVFLL